MLGAIRNRNLYLNWWGEGWVKKLTNTKAHKEKSAFPRECDLIGERGKHLWKGK